MKNVKTIATVLTTGVFLSSMLAASPTVHAAYKPILDNPLVQVPNDTTEISNKYSFIAKFIPNKTYLTTFGSSNWVKTIRNYNENVDQLSISNATDDMKGKIGVVYHNVGTYKGKQIDLKITLLDWVNYVNGYKVISFGLNDITHRTSGYDSVKQRWEYVYADSGKTADLPGSFMNINDIDYWQGVKFDQATTANIEKIYVSNNTWIQQEENNGELELLAPFKVLSPSDADYAMATVLLNSPVMTFDWRNYNANIGTSPNFVYQPDMGGASYFGFYDTKPARTETNVPTKLVSDKDEDKVENNSLKTIFETYKYEIYHSVPAELDKYFYNSYTLQDKLIDELEIVGDINVVNEEGTDVTNLFNNNSVGNQIKLVARPDALQDADFYNHTYTYQFNVKVKDGANLESYKENNGYSLPNTAKVAVNGNEKVSNSTKTLVPLLVKEKATKTLDSTKDVSPGDPVKYSLNYTIPNDHELTTLALNDDLEDVLHLEDVKIMNGNKDVTDQGIITINKDNESVRWIAKNPNDFIGATLTMKINASLKYGFDESTNKEIPNIGSMDLDDREIETNEVVVVPKITKDQAEKFVEVNGKDSKELQGVQPGGDVEYKLDFTVGNNKKIDNLSFSDDLENVLDLKDVKAFVGDKDVTAEGDLKIDDVKELLVWTPKNPQDFAGKKVSIRAKSTLKYGFDGSPYETEKGTIEIPNIGSMKVNDITTETDKVVVVPKIIDKKAEKFVEVDGKDSKELQGVKPGEDVNYKLDFIVDNNKKMDNLSFSDDLEDALDLKDVKVFVGDKDVTAEGELKIDNDKELLVWIPKNPQNFAGKKVSIKAKSTLKYGFDETPYKTKNGTVEIPNIGSMKINDEETKTDKVVVVPKIIDNKAEKFVEVDGKDSKELQGVKPGEDVNYKLNYTVGNNQKIDKLSFSDDLEDVLDFKGVKVFVGDKDVTAEGDLKVDDAKESFIWTPKNSQDFIGKEVSVEVSATLKYNFDESTYKAKNGINEIPNIGSMTIDNKETKTDKVVVVPKIINNKAEKYIEDDGEDLKEKKGMKPGDNVEYRLDFTVSNNQKIDKLSFSDNLEDVLDLKAVKVFVGDKDVTAEGELKIDDAKESLVWTPKNPQDFAGQKVSIKLNATLKETDLAKYKKGDEFVIPNVARMLVKDSNSEAKVNTNEVDITSPVAINSLVKKSNDKPDEKTTEKSDKVVKNQVEPKTKGFSKLVQTGAENNLGWFVTLGILMLSALGGLIYTKRRKKN